MENHKLYLYPVWLRIWHAINALGIIILIITGLSMQYGNVEFPLLGFKTAVSLHNICGVLVAINYLLFLVGNALSGNFVQYLMKFRGVGKRLWVQLLYYVSGYFKGESRPYPISKENKFNPLQRVSYLVAMYMLVPIIILTGIGLLYPNLILERFFAIGGVQFTAVLHSVIGFFISLFLVIHLYVASIGKNPLRNFRSIINGYHHSE